MAPIRLITLDLDDTVWPCRPVIMAAEQALYAWLQEHAGRITDVHSIESLRSHRLELRARRPEIAHDLTTLRLTALRMLMNEFAYSEGLAEQGMGLFQWYRNQVTPFPDVAPVLRDLGPEYRLVSVTNGNADGARSPLRGLFHCSFMAERVGAAKPDPALFAAALNWAGVSAGEVLHVGDEPWLDVAAAQAFGLRAVWMNRGGASWPDELAPPLVEVRDMYELQLWLQR